LTIVVPVGGGCLRGTESVLVPVGLRRGTIVVPVRLRLAIVVPAAGRSLGATSQILGVPVVAA